MSGFFGSNLLLAPLSFGHRHAAWDILIPLAEISSHLGISFILIPLADISSHPGMFLHTHTPGRDILPPRYVPSYSSLWQIYPPTQVCSFILIPLAEISSHLGIFLHTHTSGRDILPPRYVPSYSYLWQRYPPT
jgi:hypothetical protein